MSNSGEPVYILENDLKRFRNIESGEGYDLEAFGFDEVADIRRIDENNTLNLPTPTFFYQYKRPEYLRKLDSFCALEGVPIFSSRMIETLLSVSDFKYRKYPIAVLEERGRVDPYTDVKKFKSLSLRDDLFMFQTLEFCDIFDWEKSEYSKYDEEDSSPGYVRKYVLKELGREYPPLFRLLYPPDRQSVQLFISKEAREALKEAEITGTAFTSLLRPRGNSEVDISVDAPGDLVLRQKVERHQTKIDKVFARAKEERLKGNDEKADLLDREAHNLMRDIGY
jgi:hypothetical protein